MSEFCQKFASCHGLLESGYVALSHNRPAACSGRRQKLVTGWYDAALELHGRCMASAALGCLNFIAAKRPWNRRLI